eukprot:CAMPEP_0115406012 /NCGR_PEP_ID=MMETSP0271-20121206/18222_2 /TAXON_ID=71861 /ORGANISM="Scrippsiella trochoidea, Strain CCMP3099" /LENGTH=104 /DNA_ID=CAMNT_0002830021 /DNA_START=251 /DNA_END=562 /DNA_ORIENTATION=-
MVVVLFQDLAVLDGLPEFAHHRLRDVRLLTDHDVVLVVGVVRVAQPPVRAELELEELVPELALVPDVVADVELLLLLARHRPLVAPGLLLLLALSGRLPAGASG